MLYLNPIAMLGADFIIVLPLPKKCLQDQVSHVRSSREKN